MSLPAFLGTHKAGNYTDIVADLTQSYKAMGCNMSLNVLCFNCRLEVFLENLGTVSERWPRKAISQGYLDYGTAVLKQKDSQYVGWLLLYT